MPDLPLTKVSETESTITLGWTPIVCEGYEFLVDGKRASNTWDPSRSSVKFKKTASGKYGVRALGVTAEGFYPPVIPPSGTTPPASIPADGSADATAALNAWMQTVPDGTTVTFPGRYRIDGTLELRGRTLTLTGGTFFAATPPVENRSLWKLRGGHVTVRNMVVTGSYTNGGTFVAALQHAHGIEALGATVELDHVTVSQVAGDCVYLGLGDDGATWTTGTIHDSTLTKTGRNGISVVAGRNITIQRNTLDVIGYDVIDLEPNIGISADVIDGILIDGNTIGAKFGITVFSIFPNQPIRNVRITDNHSAVGKLSSADLPTRPQNITFTGNTSTSPTTASFNNIDGLTADTNANSGYTILKVNCTNGTPPAGIVADAWQVDMRLNQTNEGVHSGAWIKSWRKAPSGYPADWDEQGIILFKDFPDKYWMITGTSFKSGYPGRFQNFHLVGGDASHGGVSPLSLDYHPGRSNDWPPDIQPGVVLTCEAELDDHRRGHWQVLLDAEAKGGEFTFQWEIAWRQNPTGSVNLEVHKNGSVYKRVSVGPIKTAYDNQQPMLFTWLGAYESNGDQKSTTLQTLDYRGRTLAEAKADIPRFGSIWHTTGPNGDSNAVKDGTLTLT